MNAIQSLVLIEMGSDPRIPREAMGYVADLSSESLSINVRDDRLSQLYRYVPDLVDQSPQMSRQFTMLNAESLMRCPKCGSKEIRYVEDVPRVFRSYSIVEGTIIWNTDDQETCWEGCHDEQLECAGCNTAFPIPEGLEMDFD